MVATDIAARGLDVESISHVINFDIPDTVDAYIHRIGRTGRAERTGDAYTLITPEDQDMVRSIEKVLGKPLAREKLNDFDYSAPAPEKPANANAPFKVHGRVVPAGKPKSQQPSSGRSSWR
jgi:ATP-dependent RNA helicase RhlE